MAPMPQTSARLKDSVCVVTGGSSGIGKEVVHGLMSEGAHVIIASRNQDTCRLAQAELQARGSSGSCACAHLDLEDFASVRAFAAAQRQALKESGKRLQILVNNAGVMNVSDTADGEDRHLLANHYGPFLLTHLLLPSMGRGSRIVNVSSRAHFGGKLHFSDADGSVDQHPTWWMPKYARSKLANVCFTSELNRRLQGRGIHAFSTSPGPVNTGLFRDFPWYTQWLLQPLARNFFRTPKQGAQSTLFAALAPELEQEPMLFIHDNKKMEVTAQGKDASVALKLWKASELLVELGRFPEDKGCALPEAPGDNPVA